MEKKIFVSLAVSLSLAAVATGVLFGSAPALFAGARSVGDVLRSETRAFSFSLPAM